MINGSEKRQQPPHEPSFRKWILLFTTSCIFFFPASLRGRRVGAGPERAQAAVASPQQKKAEIMQWIRQLASTEYDKRCVAENRLAGFTTDALPYMMDALKDPDPFIRSGIVETMCRMSPSKVEPILKEFKGEKKLMVKVSYFTLFNNAFPNEVDVENAIIKATYDLDERSRAEAAIALGHMRADRSAALARLLKMLNDPTQTEYVKNYVVQALRQLGSEDALDSLERLVDPGDIGTGPFQIGVISAIGRIGTPRGVKILIQCLNHPRVELITTSFGILISMNFVSVKELVPILEDHKTPPAVRANAAWVLGSMGEFLKGLKESKSEELSSYVGRAIRALEEAAKDKNEHVVSRTQEALTNLERAGLRIQSKVYF